jgi:hypothetical protein
MAKAMTPSRLFSFIYRNRSWGRLSAVSVPSVAMACTALAAIVAFLPCAALAFDDDLVPAGIVKLGASVSHETNSKAVARDSVNHGLEVYALPDPSDAGKVSGTLSRDVNETDLAVHVGLTDHWNLALVLPYVEVTQRSTLKVISPGADTTLDATVANLQNKTISGMGNYRLTSIHRPLFTDSNAITWGWGLTAATERNTGIYTGVGSFQTRDPYGSYVGFFHFTHYPKLYRSRIDTRFEYQLPQKDKVNLPTGQRVDIQGAPAVLISVGWEHEPGAWGYGFRIDQRTTLQTRIGGEAQNDPVKEWVFHAQIGLGNLIALENAPIRFPYQTQLTWDTTFFAYNAPIRDRWGFQFITYF